MCKIEYYVNETRDESPIVITSAYDKLVEKFRAAHLAWQQYHPQLVKVYRPQIVQVSEGESPKSFSDSAAEWDDAQIILPCTYVRMWLTTPVTPLSLWWLNLSRKSDSPEIG